MKHPSNWSLSCLLLGWLLLSALPLQGQDPLSAAEAAAEAALADGRPGQALNDLAQVLRLRETRGTPEAYVATAADLAMGCHQHDAPDQVWQALLALDTTSQRFRTAPPPTRGDFFNNFAAALERHGHIEASYLAFRQALQAYQQAPVTDTVTHLSESSTWQMLSLYHSRQTTLEQARDASWQNLRLRRTYAPHSPLLGDAYSDLGHIYDYMGRIDSAIWAYEEALSVFGQVVGPHHQSVGLVANNLGVLMGKIGDYESERDYALQALT
ncbi:MAG: tetratricopeptide repeat protein, partial [Bacteroidetes bacterium]